jgi:hypothetical protein
MGTLALRISRPNRRSLARAARRAHPPRWRPRPGAQRTGVRLAPGSRASPCGWTLLAARDGFLDALPALSDWLLGRGQLLHRRRERPTRCL